MAKEKEKTQARMMFVEMGKSCKEIGSILGVSERSLGLWRKVGKWDDLRAAKVMSSGIRTDNLRKIINNLSERRIDLDAQLREAEQNGNREECEQLLAQIAGIDDSVSKWNKTLESVTKEGRIPVSTQLAVMETIFNYMRSVDEKLYMQCIEFQDRYVDHLLASYDN